MTPSLDRAVEALKAVVEADGGMDRYAHEEDEVGGRACCNVVSYMPHDPDCYVIKCATALAALPHLSPGVELRALVEKWRRASSGCFNDRANAVSRCADELAAIIDNKQE